MTIIFSAHCKQYECPNMMKTCSIFPDSNTICIKNQNILIQKRLLRAELVGNMFQAEPKFQIDHLYTINGNLSNNKTEDQQILAIPNDNNSASSLIAAKSEARRSNSVERFPYKPLTQNELNHRRQSGTEYQLTEHQIANPAQFQLRITLSEYQLLYHRFVIIRYLFPVFLRILYY